MPHLGRGEVMKKVIHFDGCGAAFPYSVGYALHLLERYALDRSVHFSGVSSGGIVAAFMAFGVDPLRSIPAAFRLQKEASHRALGLMGVWRKMLERYYAEILPDDYDYNRSRRLHIRVTHLDFRPRFVRRFDSKNDLVEALMASQHIPFFLDWKPLARYRGRFCFDGQWFSKARPFGKEVPTLDVAPVSSLLKKSSVPFREVFTRKSPERIYGLLRKGYEDAGRNGRRLEALGLKWRRGGSRGVEWAVEWLRPQLEAPE